MRPLVFEYTSCRHLLRDLVQWIGLQDRKYSLRWIAKRSGFSSPSLLSMVLSGQRTLARDKLPLLCEALRLMPDEVEYMRLIFELEATDDPKEKKRWERLIQKNYRGGLFSEPSEEGWEVFSKWYLPAIRELIAVKDFRADPFWIARKIGISPPEARDGLAILLKIGLAKVENGKYLRAEPSVQPKDPPSKFRMDLFNTATCQKGLEAISLPREQRYFNTLTMAISRSTFEKLPEILSRLIAEVDMLAEADTTRDDIAQLSIQFFSVTENAANREKETKNNALPSNEKGSEL